MANSRYANGNNVMSKIQSTVITKGTFKNSS